MKKLLFLLLLLPVFAFAQIIPPVNDSTAIGTPGAAYTPSFRTVAYGGKSLFQVRIGTSAKWMTLSTTQYNRNYMPQSDSLRFIWNANLNGATPQNAFIYLDDSNGIRVGTDAFGIHSYVGTQSFNLYNDNGVRYAFTATASDINLRDSIGDRFAVNTQTIPDTTTIQGHKPIKFTSQIQSSHTPVEDEDLVRKKDIGVFGVTQVDNGLTKTDSVAELGGDLIKNTTVSANGYNLNLSGNASSGNSVANIQLQTLDHGNANPKISLTLNNYITNKGAIFNMSAGQVNLQAINGTKVGTIIMDGDSIHVNGRMMYDSIPNYTNPLQFAAIKDVTDKSTTFVRSNISISTDTNTRKDMSSIVRLSNGNLAIAYNNFNAVAGDTGESSIYYQISQDEGVTWGTASELIAKISLGSYNPSFYKKANGNILCVFFVRETITPSYTSTLRQIEFSGDLQTVITPQTTILATTGYYPIAADRLYYDEIGGRLIMPYPSIISGDPATNNFVSEGKLLVSTDEGGTWSTLALALPGVLNATGFGGVSEPGIFKKESQIVYYFRTQNNSIYAYDLTYSTGNYTASAVYNIGLKATAAMSTIKRLPLLDIYVATYTRLMANQSQRKIIDLSISSDGVNWGRPIQVANALTRTINEPGIFFNDITNSLIVPYSYSPSGSNFDLLSYKIPYSSLVGLGDTKTITTFATNPLADEHAELTNINSTYSSWVGNRLGNISRNYINIANDITATPSALYGFITFQQLKSLSTKKTLNLDKVINHSLQSIIDNIAITNDYTQFSIAGYGSTNFTSTASAGALVAMNIEPILSGTGYGTAGKTIAYRQQGGNDMNVFMGTLGLGLEPTTYKFDVLGDSRFNGLIVKSGGLATQALMADGSVKLIGNIDNTSDLAKPVSTATSAAIAAIPTPTLQQVTTAGGSTDRFFKITGQNAPVTGSGLELSYNGTSFISSYNRTGAAYLPMIINGSTTTINNASAGQIILGGALRSTVLTTAGLLTNDASGNITSTLVLPSTVTATTQTVSDNSTKVATTANVQSHFLTATATLDFTSTASQTSAELTITVTGAADGDVVSVGIPNVSANANSCFTARVSATNTVTVKFNNYSAAPIDPASGTFKVTVFK